MNMWEDLRKKWTFYIHGKCKLQKQKKYNSSDSIVNVAETDWMFVNRYK